VREGRPATRWQKALSWLPVALLLAGVMNHLWQVQRHQLSPWLGAGFGMFATTDLDSARQVYLTAVLEDGRERELALTDPYRDTLKRARALPSGAWLQRLATATFDALEASPELEFPARPVALRIDIWRLSYHAKTLEPNASLLVNRTYPFPADDR
jgi:hypothetical protein